MQQKPDDNLMIQMTLQGQQSAFAMLVNKYQAYVFTLVMRYINDRGVAEELAQDVFIKAYRNLADFKGTSKFSTWLYTIVHTTCLSHLRKRKDNAVLLEHEQMLSLPNLADEDDNITGKMEQAAQKNVLNTAINSLPAEDAEVITLYYQMEQSIAETAMILGITAGNVKVKLFRARQKLREVLETKFMNELT